MPYTNAGELVLDNCMGVRSKGIACVNAGGRFAGFEIDPEYFSIAAQRIGDEITESAFGIIPVQEKTA